MAPVHTHHTLSRYKHCCCKGTPTRELRRPEGQSPCDIQREQGQSLVISKTEQGHAPPSNTNASKSAAVQILRACLGEQSVVNKNKNSRKREKRYSEPARSPKREPRLFLFPLWFPNKKDCVRDCCALLKLPRTTCLVCMPSSRGLNMPLRQCTRIWDRTLNRLNWLSGQTIDMDAVESAMWR